jgi:exodeoxyribonuclease X
MTGSPETPTLFRITDLETSGTGPNDAVVEIGAVDLVGGEMVIVGSDLVRPPVASAIHQITDEDVTRCPMLEEVLPFYMDANRTAAVEVFVAHHWRLKPSGSGNSFSAALPFALTRRPSGSGRRLRVTAIRS